MFVTLPRTHHECREPCAPRRRATTASTPTLLNICDPPAARSMSLVPPQASSPSHCCRFYTAADVTHTTCYPLGLAPPTAALRSSCTAAPLRPRPTQAPTAPPARPVLPLTVHTRTLPAPSVTTATTTPSSPPTNPLPPRRHPRPQPPPTTCYCAVWARCRPPPMLRARHDVLVFLTKHDKKARAARRLQFLVVVSVSIE